MAIVFASSTVATAAATVFQVFKANLVGAVTSLFETALNIGGVSVQQYRAHCHSPRTFVCQGALAIGMACEQVAGLLANHFSYLTRAPNIHQFRRQLNAGMACLRDPQQQKSLSFIFWHQ